MNEKRFSVDDDGIYDTQEKMHFKFIAYDWIDCDIYECCEKLNEQDKKIRELESKQHRKVGGWHNAKEYFEKLEGDERQQD